jgi:hypothetical protein
MLGSVYKNPNYYYGLALIYDNQTNSFSKLNGNNHGGIGGNVADILYF